MILKCQSDALAELQHLAESDRHSILIDGPTGCGKSYLAKQYAALLGVEDFAIVGASVQSIRESINSSYNLDSPIVFCIENLDTGAAAASYTLLKFLEEPLSHVYIVVTCRNMYLGVPDTIISRSACVSMSAPTESDILKYAESVDRTKYQLLSNNTVWAAAKTFKDVDNILRFTPAQLDYYASLQSILTFKDTVSNLAWKLGHYDDGSETDVLFVMNYIMSICNSGRICKYAMQCTKDLNRSRIAPHAALSKFLFDCKYGD